jgi:C4-dicarboxylate transporter, DctM subunit
VIALAIAICVIFLISRVPFFMAFAFGGLIIITLDKGLPFYNMGVFFFDSINSFLLLAIPLFTLAGQLMADCGMGKSLVDLLRSFVGRLPGGMGVSAIIASVIVGALTGSNLAVLTSVGSVLYPAMESSRYSKGYSGSILVSSCQLGILIPPSVPFVIFGFMTQASVPKLFMAGVLPGVLLAGLLSITAIIIAIRRKYYSFSKDTNWRDRGNQFVKSIPAILMPVIVLGGIYAGIFTPTEAAAVACVYTILIGFFVYRGLNLKTFWNSVRSSVDLTSIILVMMCGVMLLNKALLVLGMPQAIGQWIVNSGLSPTLFMLMIVVIFVILGTFMDAMVMVALIPVLVPGAIAAGFNLIHLGVVFVVGSAVGTMTPPAAGALFLASAYFKIPLRDLTREVLPFLMTMVAGMLILAFVPQISLWLPGKMFG